MFIAGESWVDVPFLRTQQSRSAQMAEKADVSMALSNMDVTNEAKTAGVCTFMYFPFTFNKSASSKLDQTFPTPTYHPGIGGVKSCGGQDEEQ